MDGAPGNGGMARKVVVVTGANSGLGLETAAVLAGRGAHVVMTARNRTKGEAAAGEVRRRAADAAVDLVHLDLASFASIRACAAELLHRYERIDVLVCNAGLTLGRREETDEGFEMTFGVNHLGHFLLTDLLVERITVSAPARIVVVASDAHRFARRGLDFDDLQSTKRYRGFAVYSASKLANVLFTRELARRLDGTGVTANSLHPGFVATNFGKEGDTRVSGSLTGVLLRPFQISPERGARTQIWLASSPEVEGVTGDYFAGCRPKQPSGAGRDDAAAARLWDVSTALVAQASA